MIEDIHENFLNKSIGNCFEIRYGDIILREFQLDHLDAIYNITLEPEIQTFLPDWISTKEQRQKWLETCDFEENQNFKTALPHILDLKDDPLRMVIINSATEEVIGWIVSGFKDELKPPNREIGYAISNKHIGKGYATQASKALIKFLFENTDTEELVATALTYNESSNRVLIKCGYKFDGITEIDQKPYNCYRMTKVEWQEIQF